LPHLFCLKCAKDEKKGKNVGRKFGHVAEMHYFCAAKTKITQVHKPCTLLTVGTQARQELYSTTMKQGIHPENYRPVVFKDMSNGDMFLSRSTAKTTDTVEFEGEEYPVVKLEISSSSHPFYTGKSKLVDTAGRVDKFMSRYARSRK